MTYWESECRKLEIKLKITDCSNFLQWDFIKNDMFHEVHSNAFYELKNSTYWEKIKGALKEDEFGKPNKYYLYPESSGNLIHHAYSLFQLVKHFPDFNIDKIASVFEFGGGYGSWCRLLRRLGFNGTYIIYDFPCFLELQSFFLKKIGIGTEKTFFISNSNSSPWYTDLFVSLWAISESPSGLRLKILDKVFSKYVLIAYQNIFEGIDNILYFGDFIKNHLEYTWKNYEIPHIKNNYYLLGERNV